MKMEPATNRRWFYIDPDNLEALPGHAGERSFSPKRRCRTKYTSLSSTEGVAEWTSPTAGKSAECSSSAPPHGRAKITRFLCAWPQTPSFN